MEPLIDGLVDKSKVEESEFRYQEAQKQLDVELVSRQEAETKLNKKLKESVEMEAKLKAAEIALSTLQEQVNFLF